MTIQRRRVWFSGHVQGVGFRMTARRLARGYPVAGTVENLDDGRVLLVVEGETAAIADFLGAIHREFGSSIRDRDDQPEAVADPPLEGFSIR